MDVEPAIIEETPVAAMPGDSATTAFVEESAVTALDVEERWPRLPRTVSTPRASPPAEPQEFVFVSGASVLVPPSPTPHRRRRRRRAHAAEEPAPDDERRRRDRRRRRRRRKPQGVSPLASPTSSMSFPDWASPTSSIASALSSPWSSPRHEHHHFPRRGDSGGSSSSFWSSTSSLWSSTTSMFSSTTSSLRSWASSSSASSLLSFAAAPAQGDGPDHYRPDSPDDFRVACRDVSMPLPE